MARVKCFNHLEKKLTFRGLARGERISGMLVRASAHGIVIYHRALGVTTAYTGAGIDALVVEAGSVIRAVGILHALGTTTVVGIAVVLGQAGAAALLASCIRTAGRGLAGVLWRRGCNSWEMLFIRYRKNRVSTFMACDTFFLFNDGNKCFLTGRRNRCRITRVERITGVTVGTVTHGGVINDVADSSSAARSGTRISASLAYARLVGSALGVNCALGSTVRWESDVIV